MPKICVIRETDFCFYVCCCQYVKAAVFSLKILHTMNASVYMRAFGSIYLKFVYMQSRNKVKVSVILLIPVFFNLIYLIRILSHILNIVQTITVKMWTSPSNDIVILKTFKDLMKVLTFYYVLSFIFKIYCEPQVI